jgi:CBS domain containing-hemolysin-like protein
MGGGLLTGVRIVESDLLAWSIFVTAVLFVALAAAAEVAFAAVDRQAIRRQHEQGNRRAARIEQLLQNPALFWLTVMTVKTAGLLVAGVALARATGVSLSTGWLTMVTIAVWLMLAATQVMARAFVLRQGDRVALAFAPFLRGVALLLTPITHLLYRLGIRIGVAGPGNGADESIFLNEAGLRLLMQVGDEGSTIQESEKEMIAGILEMDETVAREVMVPRIDMVTLDADASLQEALDVIIAAGHSRIPVYEHEIDTIVGLLYAKDLLQWFRRGRSDETIRSLLRPVYFVPASKKVDVLLREMKQHRSHLAMVVDEYGGITGLVTIEDIIEEIFGEIRDEYDGDEAIPVTPLGDGAYLLNSRLDVYSLAKLLELELDGDEVAADTLGGLVFARLGHVPQVGEMVEIEAWRFVVLSVDGRRIEQVRAEPIRAPDPAQTPRTGDAAESVGKHPLLNTSSLPNG